MITLVTLDAQQKRTVWAFESNGLVMPALVDYVSANWRRAWPERPEEIGKKEVEEYFSNLEGMEQYMTFDAPINRSKTALVSDAVVAMASVTFLLHVLSEVIQGRSDNAIGYCLYIILAIVARFGSRIWRSK